MSSQPSRLLWFFLGFAAAMGCLVGAVALVGGLDLIRNFMFYQGGDASESALASDLQTVRSQLELYKVQHLERYPDVDENDQPDTANFAARLTGRTDQDGKLNPSGQFGPYLQRFPENPMTDGVANQITFGTADPAPGDDSTGWYFNTQTGKFSTNDPDHAGMW